MQRVSYWDIVEDSGLQIITLWGPTIGNFDNINLEILDLPSPKGSKTRVHGGGVHIYIYIYVYIDVRLGQYPVVWLVQFGRAMWDTLNFPQTAGDEPRFPHE